MCDVTAAIGAAALVVGAYEQNQGVKAADKAAVNVRRAEDARQARYAQQAEAGFQNNMDAANKDNFTADQTQNVNARNAAYDAQAAAAPQPIQQQAQGAMGGNKIVAGRLGDALSAAGANAASLGDARARLASFGDTMFDTNMLFNKGKQQIGLAGNLSQNSLKPLDAEILAAGHKGSKQRALGSLLSAVGSMMLGGAGGAAGAAAGAGANAVLTDKTVANASTPLPASTNAWGGGGYAGGYLS